MQISGLLLLIALGGLIAVFGGIALAVNAAAQRQSTRGGVLLAVLGAVVAVLFFIVSQGLIVVQPQEVAVIFDQVSGQLLEPRTSGVHIIVPVIQQPTIYSIVQQEYTMSSAVGEGARSGDDAVEARTSDGQAVRIDATVIYSADPANINILHTRWQTRYQDGLVRPTARGAIRDTVAQYNVEEVYSTQRESMRQGIRERITERFAEEGLIVSDLIIRDIRFSDEYAASIEQKQIAEQNRLRQEQEAERIRIEAQGEADASAFRAEGERRAAIERANGEAESIRIRASAEAEAIRIRAEADADALALINTQLSQNPNLIQWRYVDTLSDNVQLMILPSNSPFLFDMQSLLSGTGSAIAPGPETSNVPAVTAPDTAAPATGDAASSDSSSN